MSQSLESQSPATPISNPFGLLLRARVQVRKLPDGDPAANRLTRLATRLERIVAERRHLLQALRRQRND
jgi:hypothetical protein